MKILYVHGYLGSGNGNAYRCMKTELDKRGYDYVLDSPDFPVTELGKMKEALDRLLFSDHYDYVVASSLGAFYVMQTMGQTCILVNPAMPETLKSLRDSDPEGNPKITDELLETLTSQKETFFNKTINDDFIDRTYFVFGTRDSIAKNEPLVRKYFKDSHIYHADMEHRMEPSGAKIVCDIIDKLENRN